MRWMVLLPGLLILGAALALMTLRFLPSQTWDPAAQVVVFFPLALPLALLALLLFLLGRWRWLSVITAVVALVMVATIAERTAERTSEAAAGDQTLRVGAFNAYYGQADPAVLTRKAQEHELDILCVAEATAAFEESLVAAGLTSSLPSVVSAADDGATGTVLFSRLPVRELPEVPGVEFRMPRAVVETDTGEVTVTCAHPVPPRFDENESWNPGVPGWGRELEALGDTVGASTGPQIVMGDFNSTWDHRLLRRIAGAGGLNNAAHVAGIGLTPTWPVIDGPLPFPFVTIDHVLTDLAVLGAEVIEIPGSDHRMVTATLTAP